MTAQDVDEKYEMREKYLEREIIQCL